jgi:hypothetical protein
MVKDKMINYVFESLDNFLQHNYELEPHLREQLIQFQRNYVIDYRDLSFLPKQQKSDYDFLGYIQDETGLKHTSIYNFDTAEEKDMSEDRFLENMYFGRKRNFGKNTISRISI